MTIVQTRLVRLKDIAEFESALGQLVAAAASFSGRISTQILRGPALAEGRQYHIVYTFADEQSLRDWEVSPERREGASIVEALATSAERRELTGLEAWFDLPSAAPPPSRHRMALLTWVAIWPLISVISRLSATALSGLPNLARTGITSAVMVAAMTYLAMPNLTRLVGNWISPSVKH
ncbi:hypothetical protein SPAN111604_13195 [Sphingomonas antarctica]|uniref:hypothetical protein n=1 Tax=Sphingomonas antarctica TaxID=2040274 RepID=UPI0039EB83EC